MCVQSSLRDELHNEHTLYDVVLVYWHVRTTFLVLLHPDCVVHFFVVVSFFFNKWPNYSEYDHSVINAPVSICFSLSSYGWKLMLIFVHQPHLSAIRMNKRMTWMVHMSTNLDGSYVNKLDFVNNSIRTVLMHVFWQVTFFPDFLGYCQEWRKRYSVPKILPPLTTQTHDYRYKIMQHIQLY